MSENNAQIQLISQRLVEINCKINERFVAPEGPDGVQLKVKLGGIVNLNQSNNTAVLRLNLSVFEDIEKDPLVIDAVIQGLFHWEGEFKDHQKLDQIIQANGSAILYSYFRPIITQLTVFAGVPPVIIPILDFTKMPINELENKDAEE